MRRIGFAAAALAFLLALAVAGAASPPDTVPVVYEPTGTRPTEPVRPEPPAEPEYELEDLRALTDQVIKRSTWNRASGVALDQRTTVTVVFNADRTRVKRVTIDDPRYANRLMPTPEPAGAPVLKRFYEQRVVWREGVVPPTRPCGPDRDGDGTPDGACQVSLEDAPKHLKRKISFPVSWDEQYRLDAMAVAWHNARLLDQAIAAAGGEYAAAKARNDAKRAAYAAALAAWEATLAAHDAAIDAYRAAMEPWTEYQDLKDAQRGMFVDCRVSGCVVVNSVR
ncbi:MAG: hypothetical protein OXG79_12480 [Chloroflexi bacterium]|nr:hypothetical protein [Chloroflexota bacterium]